MGQTEHCLLNLLLSYPMGLFNVVSFRGDWTSLDVLPHFLQWWTSNTSIDRVCLYGPEVYRNQGQFDKLPIIFACYSLDNGLNCIVVEERGQYDQVLHTARLD